MVNYLLIMALSGILSNSLLFSMEAPEETVPELVQDERIQADESIAKMRELLSSAKEHLDKRDRAMKKAKDGIEILLNELRTATSKTKKDQLMKKIEAQSNLIDQLKRANFIQRGKQTPINHLRNYENAIINYEKAINFYFAVPEEDKKANQEIVQDLLHDLLKTEQFIRKKISLIDGLLSISYKT